MSKLPSEEDVARRVFPDSSDDDDGDDDSGTNIDDEKDEKLDERTDPKWETALAAAKVKFAKKTERAVKRKELKKAKRAEKKTRTRTGTQETTGAHENPPKVRKCVAGVAKPLPDPALTTPVRTRPVEPKKSPATEPAGTPQKPTKVNRTPWIPGLTTDIMMKGGCFDVTVREEMTERPVTFKCVIPVEGKPGGICGLPITPKRGVGYSQLANHVAGCHQKVAEKLGISEKATADPETSGLLSYAEQQTTREYLAMMARTRMSFASLDDDWWAADIQKKKVYVLEVDANDVVHKVLLSRKNVSAALTAEAARLLKEVLSSISNKRVALTMDHGTSQQRRVITVTLHADGANFPIRVLDAPFGIDGEDGHATAVHIEKDLEPLISALRETYHLRIVGITTDNCPAIAKAGRSIAAGIPGCVYSGCGCHIIQLFIKDGLLPHFEDAFAVCEKLREALTLKDPDIHLPQWVLTRWGSRLNVVRHILQPTNVKKFLVKGYITEADVDILRRAHAGLTPFEVATKRLEAADASIFDTVLSVLEISEIVSGDPTLKEAWEGVYAKYLCSESFTVAMALLAAPLSLGDIDAADLGTYRRHVIRAAQQLARDAGLVNVDDEVVREVTALFQGQLVTPLSARKVKTLQEWWTLACEEAPILFSSFENLCCTAASEAESERVFSLIGITHTDLRCRMVTETIEALVFVSRLHSWKKWLGAGSVYPSLLTPPEPIPGHPEVQLRSYGVDAAKILFSTDSRVSSVKRASKLVRGNKIKVWFADFGGATEYVLDAKTVVGPYPVEGMWLLQKKGGRKVPDNVFDPKLDDWWKV